MRAILNTGRSIPQGVAVEHKGSADYRAVVAVCFLNPVDMMALGIEDGSHVKVSGGTESIVVVARSSEGLIRGEVFVPLGPYANHIISGETHATGMPDFKSEEVEVVPTDEPVKGIGELLEEIGGARYDH